jgi:tetratricopeptide (TPR) repeat protein
VNGETQPTGSIDAALEHARRLLTTRPHLALEQAREILKAAPNHPVAALLEGLAQRACGDLVAAAGTLSALTGQQPRWALAHYELGVTLSEASDPAAAVVALRRAVELKPDLPDAWRALGDALADSGDARGAQDAHAAHVRWSTRDPRLLDAATALVENRVAVAEQLLRTHLKQFPTDVAAIRMFAEVAARFGRLSDAETLLQRCLEIAPGFHAARHNYVQVLLRLNKPAEALRHVEMLCAAEPTNAGFRNLKAVVLGRIGDFEHSLDIYADILARYPEQARIWMNYAHALSTVGREQDSIAAYQRSIALMPGVGEAYWSLANLKTFRFPATQIAEMRRQIERGDLSPEDRFHLHFALGKALEDGHEYASAFEHYAEGNRLRRSRIRYDAAANSEYVGRLKAFFTADLFAERGAGGLAASDPIFIVGLPRAGSTLIEQILASHSRVEGTMELPDLEAIVGEVHARARSAGGAGYPQALRELDPPALRALGEEYLERTRIHRWLGRPVFIDKMPNNFFHVGLIRLILPGARVIDARRHPMACGFSAFKQHFARGQHFSYDLTELGRYYRDYVDLMAHFDRVLPGFVHRVFHERLVTDTEHEVRRLLEFCGLPFEDRCLRFHETERAVRTASAQQVRKPIFREGLDQWRRFEAWLGPLAASLGDVVPDYPAAAAPADAGA